jgi:hypothetical protein
MALKYRNAAIVGRHSGYPREGAPHSILSNSTSIKSCNFVRLLHVENGIIDFIVAAAISSRQQRNAAGTGDAIGSVNE